MLDIDATLGFAGHPVLEDFRLTVQSGEGICLVGPNGSGKTTLLRTVAGLQLPRSGRVLVAGHPAHERRTRQLTGFVPDPPPLYEELTPWEHLELLHRLWSGRVSDDSVAAVVADMGLESFLHQRCDTLSLGMRKRLGITLALVHRPPLLLLDEPFNGLDRETAADLQRVLRTHLGSGGCFVASSHQHEALAEVSSRTVSLNSGHDSADDLRPAER